MNHFNTTGSDPRSEQYYLDGLYLYCRPFLNQLHYFSCFTLHASLHTQIPTLPHTHQNQSHTDSTLSASLLWFGVFAHLVSTVGASDLRQLCLPEPQQFFYLWQRETENEPRCLAKAADTAAQQQVWHRATVGLCAEGTEETWLTWHYLIAMQHHAACEQLCSEKKNATEHMLPFSFTHF